MYTSVGSRSDQGTLRASSRYAHDQLTVLTLSAQGKIAVGGLARLFKQNALAALERSSFCLINVQKITNKNVAVIPLLSVKYSFEEYPPAFDHPVT
jgi:hypothetical protein